MIPLLGLILVALGASLLVLWWPAVAIVLQGLLVTTLLLVGAVLLLVGVSENRARRQYHAALTAEDSDAEADESQRMQDANPQ